MVPFQEDLICYILIKASPFVRNTEDKCKTIIAHYSNLCRSVSGKECIAKHWMVHKNNVIALPAVAHQKEKFQATASRL